jgi:branched-chain amino acid transport system substrate-binding protein
MAVAVLVVVTALTGCSTPAPAPPPTSLVIGFLAAAGGGSVAAAGADALRGARLAVDVVNRSFPDLNLPLAGGEGLPGLGGVPVTLAHGATDGSPTEAAARVNALVARDKAVAVVTADTADVAAAVGSEAQRLSIPVVDGASTADFLTELGLDWYFRTGPTDRVIAETVFDMLASRFGAAPGARLAIVAEPGQPGAAGAVRMRELADRAGYAVVRQVELARTVAGRRGQASLLSSTDCDVVLAVAGTRAAVEGIGELTTALSDPAPVIGLGPAFGILRPRDLARDGGSGPAVLRTASWSAEFARRSPVAKPVADLYERQYGLPMSSDASNAFTATLVLAAAIDGARSAQPAAIRAALRKMSVPATQMIMPWGGIRFDANGQNQLAAAVVEGLDGSSFRVTYPPELVVGGSVWPGRVRPATGPGS